MTNSVGRWVLRLLVVSALLFSMEACGSSPGEGLPTLRIWLDEPRLEGYAKVYVDGKLVSSALRNDVPVDIKVKPGEHDIAVELDGYGRATEHIEAHETIIQEFHFAVKRDQLGPPPTPVP